MAKTNKTEENPFAKAVGKCPEINGMLCQGLTAMGKNSTMVKPADPRLLDGSVDIDSAVKSLRPNEPRWDYAIGYAGCAYLIEVHPADTKNIDEMVKKAAWLRQWLETAAPDLKKLHRSGSFHWIPSGRVKILKTSPQYKKIAANNISLVSSKPMTIG